MCVCVCVCVYVCVRDRQHQSCIKWFLANYTRLFARYTGLFCRYKQGSFADIQSSFVDIPTKRTSIVQWMTLAKHPRSSRVSTVILGLLPGTCQKSPVYLQKSSAYMQKSTGILWKSSVSLQKRRRCRSLLTCRMVDAKRVLWLQMSSIDLPHGRC